MNPNTLVVTVEATHQSLRQRLDEATRPRKEPEHPRAARARVNAFMAATSRHLAAVDEALLPEVARRMPDGRKRVTSYLHEARLLEQALVRLKARCYGELHMAHVPWAEVWGDVRRQLASHNEKELALTREVTADLAPDVSQALADRVYRAELRAPTRGHPYLPHRGLLGHTARRVWAVADRFWDATEGREIPPPVRPRPKDHSHESLLSQYLVGEPLMDADAPVVTHRPHRRRAGRAKARGGR
ncbi:MAG TPA: hypothetical protein VFG72_13715 [Marmoricola sp.]|nr:hypothetical protein [Marmoricola sp.]